MKLDRCSMNSSNLDHSKGDDGMVAFQNKQQVTAQSLGSYSQEVKQTGSVSS